MQHSALPDLAHTDSRAVHWLATAAAMAAVVALAGLLQPGSATATATPAPGAAAAPRPAVSGPAPAAPDPAAADFPLACGPVGHTVADHVAGDLDGDGAPETVALVHCDAGSGTPPGGVYVLTGSGTAPRVVATLVDPARKMTVTGLAVQDGVVSATLLGYSSLDVPRCCPDLTEASDWRWSNGAFVRSTRSDAGTTAPAA
ncbi:hypothetical protein [uncultured Streptomyces sp.]|uniref:hypothetical protein n=1 Tax=uncultured Streptomyces sp. TaxID=174707 RepID=UPI0026173F7F|nr:hypothetical protein [uncultured Streptomyces sp.]